jgi:UDP-2-acetamido-3-amino-2,3-dideoxy-glucuronate N-acetyltransferase
MNDVFIHNQGICESKDVGKGTRIWAFAHVLPGASIGEECNICDGVFIENEVRIGNRVTIKCGVQLWDGVTIDDDVFIGPNATFSNNLFPRSKMYLQEPVKTHVRTGASIGANATILPGIEIGSKAMVGAGSVVTMNVPPNAVVYGNPAKIVRYLEAGAGEWNMVSEDRGAPNISASPVKGVLAYNLSNVLDMRGNLSSVQFEKDLPFGPKRFFAVYEVTSEKIRGEHAHRQCKQFLVCIHGSCAVVVDDGEKRAEYTLDRPDKGLYIPPMVWGVQYNYSRDAVLLIFASHEYDASDYIRNYDEWLKEIAGSRK